MTTLVMVGRARVRHRRLSRAAGGRVAERRFPDDLGVREHCPARRRRRWHPQSRRRSRSSSRRSRSIDSMTSTSSLGSTSITLQFTLDRNIDAAAQDVQAAISAALRQLPPQMTTPPTFRKVNPADSPIFYIAFTSKTLRLSTLDEYAENTLAQRISTVSGVAQVNVYGSQKYAVRIDLDPDALSGRGLGIDTVAEAIGKGNVNLPTGTLYGPNRIYNVNVNGQMYDAAAFGDMIVTYQNGAPVRLKDVAQRLRRHAERQGRRDDQRRAGRRPRDPEAARHEHDQGRRGHQEDAAGVRAIAAGRRRASTSSTIARRASRSSRRTRTTRRACFSRRSAIPIRCSSSSRSASTARPRATCPRATTRSRSARRRSCAAGKQRHDASRGARCSTRPSPRPKRRPSRASSARSSTSARSGRSTSTPSSRA